MGYSIFYPYRGMRDQIFRNKYVLERMVVWLINPLELNYCQFEKMMPEKDFQSPTKKKELQIYQLEKYTLR